ncbi:HupE/UreJ family protein [Chitinophaga nivalis]|uniref:HupE/UreJ family protein n=1 Tax=Chitinophaga nivalis TaxID=2991709 RepID=A0ABT3IFR4_9BACT|nr:HupE/UreJ family protein [Chitinophaga nivalis]MCW3467518.1 HupE/UreJ family protein [Chitinophaga nivalis]MCW3482790.1 HupE/UreJ family protein [Chitinophaga nivalis]
MDELYFQLGWQHILNWDAYDHILFVIALSAIYVLRDWKKVLVLVTAFTIGHSITLALSVLHIIRIPGALIEFLIPVTICITAFSNIVRKEEAPRHLQLNYFYALFFGLIHGLGFSNYLKSLLGSQANIVQPLLGFNIGLEFGQILIVLTVLLLSAVAVNMAGVKRRDWNMFLSSATFGIAFLMVLQGIRAALIN